MVRSEISVGKVARCPTKIGPHLVGHLATFLALIPDLTSSGGIPSHFTCTNLRPDLICWGEYAKKVCHC